MPLDSSTYTTTQSEDIQALLLRAALLIEQCGLAKHTQMDDRGRLCVHGAICVAASGMIETSSPLEEEGWRAVRDFLVERRAVGVMPKLDGLAAWNNKWWRTKGQVVRALRRTAKAL